ncbi:unnamed protein product [Prunus armeniaca]|uniref:Uncharacterized protein n=1 Tax=Prunus armeniaca TaxID=36596 RepID=A0A6J5WA22_PRUAR|nr:unnamed protein product [Prunus armeniaca]
MHNIHDESPQTTARAVFAFELARTWWSPHLGWGRATLNLYVEDKLPKATPGGTGGVKSITNYSPAASSSFMQVISFSVGFDGLGWAYAPLPTQNKANLATHD